MEITKTTLSAFDKIDLHVVGPLDRDIGNNRYILTIQCVLTKCIQAVALKIKEPYHAGTVSCRCICKRVNFEVWNSGSHALKCLLRSQ